MGDWEDLTEMFGLDASASWDEVARRMGVDDDEKDEARSRRASYTPTHYDPDEDSRVERAPTLIAAALSAAGCWGPVMVELEIKAEADPARRRFYKVRMTGQRTPVGVVYPPSGGHGWRFYPLVVPRVQRSFTLQDQQFAEERISDRLKSHDYHMLEEARLLRDAMQLHFGRPGASEDLVWKSADYSDLEKLLRLRIEFDHFPGRTVVHAGRSAPEIGQLEAVGEPPLREALVHVRHCLDGSWIERAEGDPLVLAGLIPAICSRSLPSRV